MVSVKSEWLIVCLVSPESPKTLQMSIHRVDATVRLPAVGLRNHDYGGWLFTAGWDQQSLGMLAADGSRAVKED